jgi:hypothetical protein
LHRKLCERPLIYLLFKRIDMCLLPVVTVLRVAVSRFVLVELPGYDIGYAKFEPLICLSKSSPVHSVFEESDHPPIWFAPTTTSPNTNLLSVAPPSVTPLQAVSMRFDLVFDGLMSLFGDGSTEYVNDPASY